MIEVVVLIILLLVAVLIFKNKRQDKTPDETKATQPTQATTQQTTPKETDPTVQTETQTTETEAAPTEPSQVTEPTVVPTETTAKPTQPVKPTATTGATVPDVPVAPTLTEPGHILPLVKEQLDALSGKAEAVETVANPLKLTFKVSGTDTVENAAKSLADQIKTALNYDPAKANPNVPVGDPNPFTYQYNLFYQETEGQEHIFVLEYRFVSVNYQLTEQNYTTNQLVADVCGYLSGLNKVKYDSLTEGGKKQVVIIPVEHSYETALNIVKAQVENVTRDSRNFDFYYVGLTVTTKGGQQQTALCFCIMCK